MGKVFVFLADGFEEIEGLTVVDMLRRAEIPTVTVSIGSSRNIIGAHRIEVEADIMFHEVLEAEGAMYVLPGGMPGTLHLKDHEGLGKLLQKAYKNEKYLAAICAAPTVFEKYGFLEGRKATSYPAMEEELKSADYQTDKVVVDGKIITSRGMGTAIDFATYMKLPQTADGFCQMIKDFQTKKVDVGRVNNEYFINVLAAGMLTDIAYKVPKDKKAVLGKMAYYLEGVKEFPKQLSQNMTLTFNSKEYSGTEDIMLFLVANSKSVGGFADAAPLASVSDGYLDVMIIKKMALLTEAPDLIFKLFQGEHPKHPSIEYFQTKELSVLPTEQTAGIAIDYDGEILEEGLPVDISIVPEALNLIILRTTN